MNNPTRGLAAGQVGSNSRIIMPQALARGGFEPNNALVRLAPDAMVGASPHPSP